MKRKMPDAGDYAKQQAMIRVLQEPDRLPAKSVHMVETHISWVLLAGQYAYKIKKALDLGFLDFTTLEARRFYCEEELRLNRRLAPQLYREVVPIGGTWQAPRPGKEPAIEYAVKMRRFDVDHELDRLLERGKLLPQHMDQVAVLLADFHRGLPRAAADSAYGTPEGINRQAMQNFEQLLPLLNEQTDRAAVEALRAATEQTFSACEKIFAQRRAQGCVRECHGDLHLGNIVLIGDAPVPFDCIEFNPAFRWTDVMDEVSFLMMDLLHRGQGGLAFRFLNDYLEATGDYAGVAVLRFYLAYRATVRAKVSAIRASQPDHPQAVRERESAECRRYLALASACLARKEPALIITHGLPGSGKSRFARAAVERLGAVRLRSDVERKRLFGLEALDDSRSAVGTGIYGAEATQRTYARLHELAHGLIEAGFTAIVDAAFLRHEERAQFRQLARELNVPFAIASMQAAPAELERRVVRRQMAGSDASEAGLVVLRMLQAAQQPLTDEEVRVTALFRSDAGREAEEAGWERLSGLLATD